MPTHVCIQQAKADTALFLDRRKERIDKEREGRRRVKGRSAESAVKQFGTRCNKTKDWLVKIVITQGSAVFYSQQLFVPLFVSVCA